MKPMLRETKENVQGTNSDAKETGTQINGVHQKGPLYLWVVEGDDCNLAESRASAIGPSQTPSPHTASQQSDQRYPALVNT